MDKWHSKIIQQITMIIATLGGTGIELLPENSASVAVEKNINTNINKKHYKHKSL